MTKGPATRVLLASAACLCAFAVAPVHASADTSVFDIAPAFPAGPYSTLYVDRANPHRVAVGTLDGRVAWSQNAAVRVSEARMFNRRRYDAMAIRGQGTHSNLGSQAAVRKTMRPVRLFIRTLQAGHGVVRWHYWRAITNPLTEITSLQLAPEGGRMLAATPAGIIVSDDKGGAWTRTLGGPGSMPREKIDLVGLSVIANPTAPSYVLAGTTAGVFVSTDGGMNFTPHTDPRLEGEMIFEFLWDETDPNVVLAVGPDSILQSEDAGKNFEVAFVSPAEINTVVTSDMGVFVATTEGLSLVTGEGSQEIISGESVIGVVPWDDGGVLAATNHKLTAFDPYGESRVLTRTGDSNPFIRFDGGPGLAYLMSSTGMWRIGDEEPRERAKTVPVMAMSMSAVQEAMLDNLGLGDPDDTRLHPRWYAKLLPRLVFNAVAVQGNGYQQMIDYTLPIDYRFVKGDTHANTEFSLMAVWNLSAFVFGDSHAANPDLFIESTLRGNRQMILSEVRNQYREAAMLAHRLKKPPKDPHSALLWNMRLDEHAAYLEYATGKEVVKKQTLESNP